MGKYAVVSILLVILALSVITLPPSKATSQSPTIMWTRNYDAKGVVGCSVCLSADGGYAIAGLFPSQSYANDSGYENYVPLIIKTNSLGEVEWEKTYSPSAGSNTACSIVQTEDLGYALFYGEGIVKTDVYGIVEWNKTYAVDVTAGIVTSSGEYVLIATQTVDGGSLTSQLFKINSQGNVLWNVTFSMPASAASSSQVIARSIIETKDNGYVLTGTWGERGWIAEIGSSGNVLINQNLSFDSGSFESGGFSIAQTGDGGYMITLNSGNVPWFVKTDSQGNVSFTRLYALNGFLGSIVQTEDGGFFAGGSQNENAWIVRVDSSGSSLWEATYGSATGLINSNEITTIIRDGEGGYVAVGSVDDSILLIKLAAESISSPTPQSSSFPTQSSSTPSSSPTVTQTAESDLTNGINELTVRIVLILAIAGALGLVFAFRHWHTQRKPK